MEEVLWGQLKPKFSTKSGKINLRILSDLTGIAHARMWRMYNFNNMKVSEFEKLSELLKKEE